MNLDMYLYKREKAQSVIVKMVSILCVLAIMVMPSSLIKAQAFGSNDSSQMQSAPTSPENDLAEENSSQMDNSQQIYLPVIKVSIDIASLPAFQNIVAEQEHLQDDVMQDMFIDYLSFQHPMPRTIQEMKTSYGAFRGELGDTPDTGGKGHIEAIVTGQELLQNDVMQDTFTDHLSIQQPTPQTVQEIKTSDRAFKNELDHAPDTVGKRLVEANTDGHTE